jgi:thiol peroxidase
MLSDFRDRAFGLAYGVSVKEQGLLQRSLIIVGADNKVKYFQRYPEMAAHPNYDEALEALKKLV